MENKQARVELIGEEPYLMLSVMPPDVDFEVRITTSDHFAPERGKDPFDGPRRGGTEQCRRDGDEALFLLLPAVVPHTDLHG